MFAILNQNLSGIPLVFMSKFNSEALLRAIERYAITQCLVVPSLLVYFAKSPVVDKYNISSLKMVYSGAASLSKEIEEAFGKRFKEVKLIQSHKSTPISIIIIFFL